SPVVAVNDHSLSMAVEIQLRIDRIFKNAVACCVYCAGRRTKKNQRRDDYKRLIRDRLRE
ncbi:MAG: hypothetical protein ACRCUB_02875, partial [Plesiomonas shigelloides]